MTPEEKEERILRWMGIAKCVFIAEDKIKDKWIPILRATKDMTELEKDQIADQYLRAIAKEILEKGMKQ